MELTNEDAGEPGIFANQRFIPVELAALNLQISKRQLTELLAAHGFSVYNFGQRSRRIAEADLRKLIRASAQGPANNLSSQETP